MKLADSQSNRHIVQVFNEDESKILTTILAIPNYRLEPTGETQFSFWEMPAGQPRALKAWFYPGDNFGQQFAYPTETATQIARASNENVPAVSGEDVADAEVKEVTPSGEEREIAQQDQQAETTEQQAQTTTEQQTQTTEQQTQTTEQRTETTEQETQVAEQPAQPAEQPAQPAQQPAEDQTARTESQAGEAADQTRTDAQADVTPPSEPQQQAQAAPAELPRTGSPMPLVGLAGLLAAGAALVARAAARRG
jgi:hypothetical protein